MMVGLMGLGTLAGLTVFENDLHALLLLLLLLSTSKYYYSGTATATWVLVYTRREESGEELRREEGREGGDRSRSGRSISSLSNAVTHISIVNNKTVNIS